MKKETAFDQNKIFSWIFLWSLIKMGSWFEFQINLNQLMIVKKTLEYRVYQKKVDKSETALYFVKRFNVRTFLLK